MYINHNMDNYQSTPIYKAFSEFFDSYLVNRDYTKTLSLLEDDMISVGTGEDEIAIGKESFRELLKCEFDAIPDPINYNAKTFYAKEISENVWEVFAEIDAVIPGSEVPYPTRYSGNFKLLPDGFVTSIHHMSEGSKIIDEKEFLPIKFAADHPIDKKLAAETVFDIMCKSMPGGIIAGYPTDGFPIYFCNENYLNMLGYESYEEYISCSQGLGINNIHPDDRDMVNNETMHSYKYNTQYAIEYRIRCKDGTYIHVYDIGRKVKTPDGKDIIICVLYDMTENVKLRDVLIHESQYDELTNIYNRRGGVNAIEKKLTICEEYSFAIFDVDNLKKINDIYGHKGGDDALAFFARLMEENFTPETILVRFGGDEFAAFHPKRLDREYIDRTFNNLQEKYCDFIGANYPASNSSLSIGCVTGSTKTSYDKLYKLADVLMYEIKMNGKHGCIIDERE